MTKLTLKQSRFVQYYQGNATEAALQAGYSKKTAFSIGPENLRKPLIIEALQKRLQKQDTPLIASRSDRQKFWSEVMLDKNQDMNDRLRAAELLGKSEADFIEKHLHSADDELLDALNKSDTTRLRGLLCQLQ